MVKRVLRVKLVDDNKKKLLLPKKSRKTDLGWDVFFCRDTKVLIKAGEVKTIPIGCVVKPPIGYGYLVKDRSSMGSKGLHIFAGVVDEEYIGELKIVMFNASKEDYTISYGDKIAQLILIKNVDLSVCEVTIMDNTSRGDAGFGSTGK